MIFIGGIGRLLSMLEPSTPAPPTAKGRWRRLFSPSWRTHTLVACAFFTCLVIPYFAVGTFVSLVMSAMRLESAYGGGLVYNLTLLGEASQECSPWTTFPDGVS